MEKLTHYGQAGQVNMVDITAKVPTERTAVAHAFVRIRPAALRAIRQMRTPKGSPLEVARIAGILAAKRTADLIPLCHPIPITHVDLSAKLRPRGVEITSRVTTTASTGVEMEALVAASVAALTVYDMTKALDRGIEITELHLVEKHGGKSGSYRRAKKNAPARRAPSRVKSESK